MSSKITANQALAIVPTETAEIVPIRLWRGDDDLHRFIQNAKSANTLRGFRRDL